MNKKGTVITVLHLLFVERINIHSRSTRQERCWYKTQPQLPFKSISKTMVGSIDEDIIVFNHFFYSCIFS